MFEVLWVKVLCTLLRSVLRGGRRRMVVIVALHRGLRPSYSRIRRQGQSLPYGLGEATEPTLPTYREP